jgi:hypothetical protein
MIQDFYPGHHIFFIFCPPYQSLSTKTDYLLKPKDVYGDGIVVNVLNRV